MSAKKINISEIQDISDLRNYYHSINLNETSLAIQVLKTLQTADASRELIQLYNECLWRKIKIEIIQALGFHNNQRSLEFLFDLSKSDTDLSLATYAIDALGQTQSALASRFLEELYQNGHLTKKPALVLALVKLVSKSSLRLFNNDLQDSLTKNEYTLSKNLIYALGELRSHEALPHLKNIIEGSYSKEIQLSAISSIGKISRNSKDLDNYADKYRHDAFEFQIFQQAQNQLTFRSEWKLEDYLNKLFQSSSYHKNLPLELNSFEASDVFAGIEMFYSESNARKIADTLSFLNFKDITQWYKLFYSDQKISVENANHVARSIGAHFTEDVRPFIDSLKSIDYDLACKAAVTALPSADQYFKNIISSDEYKSESDIFKIKVLNHLVDYLSLHSSDSKLLSSTSKFFENELLIENSLEVKNRLIRALAQAKLPQNKIFSILKPWLKPDSSENLSKSILFYLEHHATHQTYIFLKENFTYFENQKSLLPHFLRALTTQEADQFKLAEVKTTLQTALAANSDVEIKVLALKFLAKNEMNLFKPDILRFIKDSSPLVVVNAVIALKTMNDDDIPDLLQPLLNSVSESIQGRTLDVILCNNSLRAKRIAIDFLKENVNHIECCEKIIRHLSNSNQPLKSDYFFNVVKQIIKDHPNHLLMDSLIEFQSSLQSNLNENQLRNNPSAADLVAIDKEILTKLPKFNDYDESIKVSLRSAEVPFSKPELFDNFVDKSVCILGFTKAIDIFLEKQFGKKILIPKMESRLHEFQNIIHLAHLNEDYPDANQVLKTLSLEKHFTPHSLPVHKMTLIGKGILSSKIVNEQFKILDGLRAWAITFLLFTRKSIILPKPMITLPLDEAQAIDIAKKLMWLQDLRNPLAHRHTLTKLDEIKEIRNESYRILNLLEKTFM